MSRRHPHPALSLSSLPARPVRGWRELAWREWCFFVAVLKHRFWSFVVLCAILALGTVLFHAYGGPGQFTWPRSLYATFSLVFANPSEPFAQAGSLQVLYFLVPLVGLTIILEAIVEVSGLIRDRRRHERSWCTIMAASMHNHVVLVGLGRLGYRTFVLLRQLGTPVVVIERNEQNQFLEEVRRDGSPLLIGDARRDAILQDAHIAKARSIVCATQDDLVNLEVALDAKRFNPMVHVVLRMFDQNMADKVAGASNIQVAMSQSALAAPVFATAAMDPRVVASFLMDGRLVVVVRHASAPSAIHGQTVTQVHERLGFIVLSVDRAGTRTLFPGPSTVIEAGDGVTLQGPFEKLGAAGSDEVTNKKA